MAELPTVIEQLQRKIYKRGARIDEYFLDFDKLRTGCVTKSQFARCIGNLALDISHEDLATLGDYYQAKSADQVDYRRFVLDVNRIFVEPELEQAPTRTTTAAADRIRRSDPQLEEDLEHIYETIVENLRYHCQQYGISIRQCFKDFDKVNRGTVTIAQFERNIPRPASFEPVHLTILVEKHRKRDGALVDYLTLHRNVEGIVFEAPRSMRHTLRKQQEAEVPSVTSIDTLIRRLQVFFHKGRVRALHFFGDYDKLRSSFITSNQFVCGLSLACAGPNGDRLSRSEMQQVAEHYSSERGVNYRQFCADVDSAFLTGNANDLMNDPQAQPQALTRSQLVQDTVGQMKSEDLEALLELLKHRVSALRLDPYPLFRDFDRRHGFSKSVTEAQFHRLLDLTLQRQFSLEEVQLLTEYYRSPTSGDINYHAFLADIDSANQLQQTDQLYFNASVSDQAEPIATPTLVVIPIDQAQQQARSYLVRHNARAVAFFRDFDKLRTGYITTAQFQRGLKAMLPAASFDLLEALTKHYTEMKREGGSGIAWRRFSSDMDTPEPISDAQGTNQHQLQLNRSDDSLFEAWDATMAQLRQLTREKSLDPKLSFRDFDPSRVGLITETQFRQALSMNGLELSDQESAILSCWYGQDTRVSYVSFLEDLLPSQSSHGLGLASLTARNMKQLQNDRSKREPVEPENINQTMATLQEQVLKFRVRVQEHLRDFDKLRSGVVTQAHFRSGLSMANLSITPAQQAAVESEYASARQGWIEYRRFCSDLEKAFTIENLHLNPQQEVSLLSAPSSSTNEPAAESELLGSLREQIKLRRIFLADDFQDFDRVSRGLVTTTQFCRVLTDVGLLDQQNNAMADELAARYTSSGGVNYKRFLQDVNL